MFATTARSFRRATGVVALAAALTLTIASCTTSPEAAQPSPTATKPADASDGGSSAEHVAVEIAATPVGERITWVVGLLNASEDTIESQWADVLDPAFTAQVSAADVVTLLNAQIRPAAPFTVIAYAGDEANGVATIAGVLGDPFDLQVSIGSDNLVTALMLTPAEVPEPAASVDEVSDRLAALPVTVRALVTSTDAAGNTSVLIDQDSTSPAPLASAFKLYVLLGVQHEIAAGALSWDDELTVNDGNRSLPSGELQDEPNGTIVTVREAALKMISISDNTATDMLIERIGREAVEDAVIFAEHSSPASMQPFLTTREMFHLAFDSSAQEQARWKDAPLDERREILEEIHTTGVLEIDPTTISTDSFWQNGLDWFASAKDITAAHEALAGLNDPEIDAIMSANPGVDPAGWDSVAFKGGSSMGVMTGTWRAESADGSVLAIAILLSDDDAMAVATAQMEFVTLAGDLLRLVDAG